jgi:glycerol kinase
VRLDVLRADGGATANGFLMQFQADLLGTEVHVAAESEATAVGAAALAGLGVGVWREPDELRRLIPSGTTFEPRMGPNEVAALREGWRRALERAL